MKPPKDTLQDGFSEFVGKLYALISLIGDFIDPGLDLRWSFSSAVFRSVAAVNNLKKIIVGLTQNSLRDTRLLVNVAHQPPAPSPSSPE